MLTPESVLNWTQILFYLVTGTVVVLTYRNARKSLLNPVYTEYQKHVIDALAKLSNELADEFVPDSPNHWATEGHHVKENMDRIHTAFRTNRDKIREEGEWESLGHMQTDDEARVYRLTKSITGEPFLPEGIRKSTVEFLEARFSAMQEAKAEAYSYYQNVLARGEALPDMETNWPKVENHINDRMYELGFGISQVEEKVANLRVEIQRYLRSFDPT